MEEVGLNIKYNQLAVKRRSSLSEIGMLYVKRGKGLGFGDEEIDNLVKSIVLISKQIKEVAEQLKIQQEVDFSQVRGEHPVKDKFNELMLRISVSSEKYTLRNKYDNLVDQGIETLSQLGYFVLSAKNKNFEALPEFRGLKSNYEKVHGEYLETGKQIKAINVLAREKSEALIPILTFLLSMKDFAQTKHQK